MPEIAETLRREILCKIDDMREAVNLWLKSNHVSIEEFDFANRNADKLDDAALARCLPENDPINAYQNLGMIGKVLVYALDSIGQPTAPIRRFMQNIAIYSNNQSKGQCLAVQTELDTIADKIRSLPVKKPEGICLLAEIQLNAANNAIRLRQLGQDPLSESEDLAFLAHSVWEELYEDLKTIVSPEEGRRIQPWPHLEIVRACESIDGRRRLVGTVLNHLDESVSRLAVMLASPGLTGTALRPVQPKPIPTVAISKETPPTKKQNEGGPPTKPKRKKKYTKEEAEIAVREYLTKHAANDPFAITRDGIANETGISTGLVSKTNAWKAFSKKRTELKPPKLREIQLTNKMMVVLPSDCKEPDKLAALIEEQNQDMEKDNRRHKRRHSSS